MSKGEGASKGTTTKKKKQHLVRWEDNQQMVVCEAPEKRIKRMKEWLIRVVIGLPSKAMPRNGYWIWEPGG